MLEMITIISVVVLLLLCNLIAVFSQKAPQLDVGILPAVFAHGDHFSVGQQIGYATKDSIKYRLQTTPSIAKLVAWVDETSEGTMAYSAMLESANTTFPEYVKELEGISLGSGADFKTLFVLNTRNELTTFMTNDDGIDKVEHCSDYLMNMLDASGSDGVSEIVIGHNEDGGWQSRDESALMTIHIEGANVREVIKFTAFVYAGELPSDAFFWNEHGVVGSMNGLYPVHSLFGGLGRNFISRDLLGASSVDNAIKRITIDNQATGHSYNLASLHEKRLINVEVAPGIGSSSKVSSFVVTSVDQQGSSYSTLFHANTYKFMDVEEDPSESSAHRMARAAELPIPVCVQDILTVLGDTEDADWPIYRTTVPGYADTAYTLVTALFKIQFASENSHPDSKTQAKEHSIFSSVTLFMSNPKTNQSVNFTMPITVA